MRLNEFEKLNETKEVSHEYWESHGWSGDVPKKFQIWQVKHGNWVWKDNRPVLVKKLPKYAYHGTSIKQAEKIVKGIKGGVIHFSTDPGYSRDFGYEFGKSRALVRVKMSGLDRKNMNMSDNWDDTMNFTYKGKISPKDLDIAEIVR